MAGNQCGCALLALRALARLEQLEGNPVPLDVSLELAERAEADCLAVLRCGSCRQRRFALISVTILGAYVVDWLQRSWHLDDNDLDRPPAQLSLGDYSLDPADAETLSRELMALRLSHLAKVMDSLEDAITAAQVDACLSVVNTKVEQLRDCMQRVRALSAADHA